MAHSKALIDTLVRFVRKKPDMKQFLFYATRSDILQIIDSIEEDRELQYIRMGNSAKRDITTFKRGRDIPNLGSADCSTGSLCESFLITSRSIVAEARRIESRDGPLYCVDQLSNPESVVFTPAGRWGEDVILNGRIGSASDSLFSGDMIKRTGYAFKKYFTKIKSYQVGSQSLVCGKSGIRLTISADAPSEYDLVIGS